jgi:hypothetical protein
MRLSSFFIAVALVACAEPGASDRATETVTSCERERDEAIDRVLADFGDVPRDILESHRAQLRAALTDHYAVLCAEGVR